MGATRREKPTTLKTYRPTTPGIRHKVKRVGVTQGTQDVPKSLRRGARRHGGRNNTGRITCFHRGGGTKGMMRHVTSLCNNELGVVRGIQWDPYRSSPLALVELVERQMDRNGQLGPTHRYILAGEGMVVGRYVMCHSNRFNMVAGNRTQRGRIPVGTTVYDVSPVYGDHGKYVKTPGGSAMIQRHDEELGRTRLRMPSGELRWMFDDSYATIGSVAAKDHNLEMIGKAGTNRRRGIRPTVRGCAMNPVDHPHGGRTKGGRHDVTPWAKIAKGQPTRSRRKPMGWIEKTARQSRRERRKDAG